MGCTAAVACRRCSWLLTTSRHCKHIAYHLCAPAHAPAPPPLALLPPSPPTAGAVLLREEIPAVSVANRVHRLHAVSDGRALEAAVGLVPHLASCILPMQQPSALPLCEACRPRRCLVSPPLPAPPPPRCRRYERANKPVAAFLADIQKYADLREEASGQGGAPAGGAVRDAMEPAVRQGNAGRLSAQWHASWHAQPCARSAQTADGHPPPGPCPSRFCRRTARPTCTGCAWTPLLSSSS